VEWLWAPYAYASTQPSKHTRNVTILLDNQAAIRSMGRGKHHSGQHLVYAAQEELAELANLFPNIHITIAWIPGHCDVNGNEAADEVAKDAALGFPTPLFNLAEVLRHRIPSSVAGLKATAKKEERKAWARDWRKGKERRNMAKFDRKPPSNVIRRIYSNLDRSNASLVTQLRSQHIPLASYLHQIKAIDSDLCLRCFDPETADHFLLKCPCWDTQRAKLRKAIGRHRFNLTTLLALPQTIKATLEFVHETNKFPLLSKRFHLTKSRNPSQP
jgi:hypothetical protein